MIPPAKTVVQFLKYSTVGLSNVAISYVVFLIALKLGLPYPYALFIGHIVGVLNSYAWNKWWTFQTKGTDVRREFGTFFLVYLGTFLLNLLLLSILIELVEMGAGLAQFLLIGLITLINFIGHKYWSFNQGPLSRKLQWSMVVGGSLLVSLVIMALPMGMLNRLVDEPLDLVPGINDRTDAELFYFAYSQEVTEGYWMAGDPFSYEHRLETYVRPPFFTISYGVFQKNLGLSADKFYLFLVLFSTPLLLFLTYLFLRRFPEVSKELALFGGLFFIFGLEILWDRYALLPDFLALWLTPEMAYIPVAPLEISRLPSPNHTLFFYILTLYTTYRGLFEGKKNHLIATGLLVGFSFYVYFYLWVLWVLYFPLLFGWFLLKRDKKMLKSLGWIGGIALMISIPHWINTVTLQSKDYFYDLGIRTGIIYNNGFYWTPMEWGILILMALIYPWRNKHFPFLVLLIVAMMIGENLQVILGYNVFPDSWWGKFIRPTVLLLGVLMIPPLVEKLNRLPRLLHPLWGKKARLFYGISGALLLIANAIYIQVSFPLNTQEAFREKTLLYAPSLDWMENHLSKDSVVLGLDVVSMLLPVYTHAYPYFPYGLSLQTDEEIVVRFLSSAYVMGWSSEQVRSYLAEKPHTDYLFAYKYNKSGFTPDVQPISQNEIEAIVAQYEQLRNEPSVFSDYKLDYLFVGPQEREWVSSSLNPSIVYEEVYRDSSVKIYKIITSH